MSKHNGLQCEIHDGRTDCDCPPCPCQSCQIKRGETPEPSYYKARRERDAARAMMDEINTK
jgi:hypothetical protein